MTNPTSSPAQCPRCGAALLGDSVAGLCPHCLMAEAMEPTQTGAPAASAQPTMTPEQLAPHFPQLEILECLGRGGMGVVYKARQKSLHRLVALKLLAPERVTDAPFAARFAREAHALAALNHPHIVTVHDFGMVEAVLPGAAADTPTKLYFLLMEFVDGVNLRQAMRAGRFTPEQALSVVPPVCEALQYAHEHGVVHRDIKPENLLLDKEGRVKIADFGIAKILDENSGVGLEETQPAGTPQYMAPEQRAHRRTDHRADIYSLGVVLYEMLTGELPAAQLQPPSRKVQIDVRLDEIVLRALEQTPELRYQTAAEMRTQVEAMAQPAPAVEVVSPAGPARLSRPALWGAAWAPLFFIAFVLMFEGEVSTGEYHAPAWWLRLFAFTVLALGVAAPFGTTILGWISVAQIRRSEGKIYGFGVAVFDGLLFPLLLLDGVIVWLSHAAAQLYAEMYSNPSLQSGSGRQPASTTLFANFLHEHPGVVIFGAVLVALAIDCFIFRRVWRGLNGRNRAEPLASGPRRPGSGVAALSLAIAGLLMVGLLGLLDWSAQADLPRLEEPHNPLPWLVTVTAERVIACGLLAYLLEISALVLGLRAWRTGFGRAAAILALTAIALPIAGAFDWSNTRHRLNQADLDRRGLLTQQMSAAIGEHLTSAHLASAVLSFSISSDGDYVVVQLHDVTSTEPGHQSVVAEGRIHALDRGRGDWWVQGEGPLGQIAFAMAGQVLSHNADVRFQEGLGRPYPVRTLVRASDGTTFEVPDLAAFLPQVRRLPDYAEWLNVRGINTFYITNRSDYRFEAHYGGQMFDQSGQRRDWITELDLLRPDRTRLARIEVPPPDSPHRWSTSLFDAAGERELVRVVWKPGNQEPESVIDSIIRDPGQPSEMPWTVSQGSTIEDKTHAFVTPAPTKDLPKTGGKLTGPTPRAEAPKPAGAPQRLHRFECGFRIGQLACSPDGRWIAASNDSPSFTMMAGGPGKVNDGWQPTVKIFDAATGGTVATLQLLDEAEAALLPGTTTETHFEVEGLVFSPNGNTLAVGTGIGQVKLFATATGHLIRSLDDAAGKKAAGPKPHRPESLNRALGAVAVLAFSTDGDTLAVGGASFADLPDSSEVSSFAHHVVGPGRLALWSARTGALLRDLGGFSENLTAAAFSPDGSLFACTGDWIEIGSDGHVAGLGRGVKIWDVASGSVSTKVETHDNGFTWAIAFSPDGKRLAISAQNFGADRPLGEASGGESTGTLRIVYAASGRAQWLQTLPAIARTVGFSPAGKTLVAELSGAGLALIDPVTGSTQSEIHPQHGADGERWKGLAIAPAGNTMAIAGATREKKGFIEVWKFAAE